MDYEQFKSSFSDGEREALEESGVNLERYVPTSDLNNMTAMEYILSEVAKNGPLTPAQRSALALWLLPELNLPDQEGRPGKGPLGPRYPVRTPESIMAAKVANIGLSAIETAIRIQKQRPEIIDEMRRGLMNLSQAARSCDLARGFHTYKGVKSQYTGRKTSQGREVPIYYGKGDRWKEAVSPLIRYLMAWEKRGYEFRHVNPKEAKKRLTTIEELEMKLAAVKADLEPRAQSARLSLSQKG